MRKNQTGFTMVVVLIILVVVSLLGALAYNVTKNAQDVPATVAVKAEKPTETTAVTKEQEDAAVATVKKLYDGYQVILSDMTNSRMSELEPLRQATTASPFVYPEGVEAGPGDPVICAQDGFSSVTYGKPVTKDGKVVIPVIEVFEESGSITIYATVDVSKNKVVAIECPAY